MDPSVKTRARHSTLLIILGVYATCIRVHACSIAHIHTGVDLSKISGGQTKILEEGAEGGKK